MDGLQIAMLAPFGLRPKGTLAARMLPLAQALVRRGHTVSIVAPPIHEPRDAGRSDSYGGVMVRHTNVPNWPVTLNQVRLLINDVLAVKPDLVHLFKPKGYGGLAVLWLARRLPLVVDTDDWEGWGGWNELLPYSMAAKRLFAWQEADLPRRAAAVTVASRTLETQVWGAGVPRGRTFYLPNGADIVAQPAQGDGRTVLLYTRFWELDLHEVTAALVVIAAQRPDVRLVLVGRGERGEEQQLLTLAERAGVRQMIEYRGWLEPDAIPAVTASTDVALVPVEDTLINRARCSAKLLELMAAGLPVAGSRVGQMSEYITHGESGLLATPGDAGALAQAVLTLLADASLRARLGGGARQAAAAYSWDRLAPIAEQAYRMVQGGKQRYTGSATS